MVRAFVSGTMERRSKSAEQNKRGRVKEVKEIMAFSVFDTCRC